MGVCVKGMYLPPSCYFCPMTNDGLYLCKANNPYKLLEEDCEERRPRWCPIIETPEPHGRLIDADALIKSDRMVGKLMMYGGEYVYTQAEIDRSPTIIPASEEAE